MWYKCIHRLCIFIDQSQANTEELVEAYTEEFIKASTEELVEAEVLYHFYKDLQNGLPIDELLPQFVTKKIITIFDKILVMESSMNINERIQFFLDHYIAKPLSAGDPSSFYRLLQIMDASVKCIVLSAKIKQRLNIESVQDKISGKLDMYMC